MKSLHGAGRAALLATVSLFALAPQAFAQQAQSSEELVLDTVVVQDTAETATGPVNGYIAQRALTATKTDTPLISTPQSVSVVTRSQIEAQNAQSLNQILRFVPGVTTEQRGPSGGTRLEQFAIRGFGAPLYLDGLRLPGSRDAQPTIDPFRLERIDVIKGPASVLFGQASPGGLVNMVSKRPTEDPTGQILLQGGNFSQMRTAIDFSGPIDDEKKLLYRVLGSFRNADGPVDMTSEQRYFISPSFTWRPLETTSLTLFGHYQRDPESGYYGAFPAKGSLLNNPYVGRLPRSFYDGDPNFEQSNRTYYSTGYSFDHKFNDFLTFRSNGRWLHTQGYYKSVYASTNGYSWAGRYLNRGLIFTDVDINALTFDNNLHAKFSTGPISHSLLAGVDYQNTRTDTLTGSSTPRTLDLTNPVYYLNYGVIPYSTTASQRATQTGIYLQDEIKLDRFTLLLSGRYDWARTTGDSQSFATKVLTPTYATAEAFTGRAGLLYNFDNGLAPYISYSESFEPLTSGKIFNGDLNGPGTLPDPRTGHQYEAGIKYQPPGTNHLFSVAVFDIRQQNVLTSDPAHPTFSVQTGEIRTRGIEAEAKVNLFESLNVVAGYSYLDNKVTRDNGTATNEVLGIQVPLAGKRPAQMPNQTASLWLDYKIETGTFAGLGLAGGVRFLGKSWGDTANTLRVPSTTLVDAALSYDFKYVKPEWDGLRLSVNVQNLFDKTYVTSCSSYSWCWYGPQRNIVASLRYQW